MKKYFDLEKGDPFYSVYNFSEASLADYRVVWRQMTKRISAAVLTPIDDPVLGKTVPQTQHVVSVVAVETEDEAHFLCAMMNSATASVISSSYATGKSYGLPSLLNHLAIPRYDPEDDSHRRLQELAREAARGTAEGFAIDAVERDVDYLAGQILGLTREGLEAVLGQASTFDETEIGVPDGEE